MVNKKEKTLVLIDSHALIHRAYHALPPLNTGKGELVNAVYGFCLILLKVIKELQPDYVAAAFDLAKPTFRHREFEAYKATRAKAPDELYAQVGRVKEVLAAFNIPVFEKEGYEADDIIGTIAKTVNSQQPTVNSIIVTGDLDTLQLVNKKTSVFTLKKGVKDTMIYDNEAVVGRYGLKPEQMNDFKGLKGDPSDNIPGVPGVGEKTAIELLKQYGSIENLYKEAEKFKTQSAKLKTKTKNSKLFEKLLENKEQAFFSKYLATIKTDVPLKFKLAEALAHDYDKEKVVKLFKELGFYSLIDRLAPADSSAAGKSEEAEKTAGADDVYPAPFPSLSSVITAKKGEAASLSSVETAETCLKKWCGVYEKIEEAYRQGVLSPKIYELEKALVPVIKSMEQNGIKIDLFYLKKLGEKFGEQLTGLEEKIYKAAGVKFNINSPQQLAEILFERLGLTTKGLKKTPGKVISTAASELEKMRGQHQIVDLIMEYRELAKLKNTYIDTLPKLAASDGRLHTSFDQLGTTTGRLSSKNPNLQNIPIKTEIGREIRRAFVAEKGSKLLAADYSQIELRVVATIAQDKNMIRAFQEGKDIHTLTAAEVFGVASANVTKEMRQAAKVLNFGVIYGMSMHGFARAAKVELSQAKDFIEKYFQEFSGVARYVEKTKKEAAQNGCVETLFGRKRFIPEINSSAWNLRAAAERMAINMPIQGTAADLMKMAMVEINLKLKTCNLKLLLQVHDELIFEMPAGEVREAAREIKGIMESVYQLAVPLKVEIEAGDNWGALERLDV
jgi:DNA polymerase-1